MPVPAAFGPLTAILIAKRRRRIFEAFERNGAISAETAMTLDELGLTDDWLFGVQRARQIVLSVGEDRFYLDRDRAQTMESQRRRMALTLLALMISLAAVFWWTLR